MSGSADAGRLLRRLSLFLPLVGILSLGWDADGVLTYYWAGNAAILLTEPWFMVLADRQRQAAALADLPPPGVAPSEPSSLELPPPELSSRELPAPDAATRHPGARTETVGRLRRAALRREEVAMRRLLAMSPGVAIVLTVGTFLAHFGIFSLVHFVFLAVPGMISYSVLPWAIAAQVARRLMFERDEAVHRVVVSYFPAHVYQRVVILHVTLMASSFLFLPVVTDSSSTTALILCALGVAADFHADGRRR